MLVNYICYSIICILNSVSKNVHHWFRITYTIYYNNIWSPRRHWIAQFRVYWESMQQPKLLIGRREFVIHSAELWFTSSLSFWRTHSRLLLLSCNVEVLQIKCKFFFLSVLIFDSARFRPLCLIILLLFCSDLI